MSIRGLTYFHVEVQNIFTRKEIYKNKGIQAHASMPDQDRGQRTDLKQK